MNRSTQKPTEAFILSIALIVIVALCILSDTLLNQSTLSSLVAIMAVVIGYLGVQKTINANKENIRESAYLQKELEGLEQLSFFLSKELLFFLQFDEFIQSNGKNDKCMREVAKSDDKNLKMIKDISLKYEVFLDNSVLGSIMSFLEVADDYEKNITNILKNITEQNFVDKSYEDAKNLTKLMYNNLELIYLDIRVKINPSKKE